MEQFKNLTIGELLDILQQITRQNSDYMQENNQEALKISGSNISETDIRNEKAELYRLNAEYMKENQAFMNLHSSLLHFFRTHWKNIEFVDETNNNKEELKITNNNIKTELKEVSSDTSDKKNKNSRGLKSKSINELENLLQELINVEKYEECEIVQNAINEKVKV